MGDLLHAGAQAGPAGTRRNDLIVVASLTSKVPNLAGLARTAEVLGAGALVLADKRVTSDSGFTRWGVELQGVPTSGIYAGSREECHVSALYVVIELRQGGSHTQLQCCWSECISCIVCCWWMHRNWWPLGLPSAAL
jgi:hypothetical protein